MWKRSVVTLLIISGAFFMGHQDACAGWRIEYPDVTVAPNSTVNYIVYGEWDVGLLAFVIPTVVRSIDAGAFWTGPLPVDTVGGATIGVQWAWGSPGWAVILEELRPGVPSGACAADGDLGYDAGSPDHFAMVAQGAFVTESPAPTGRNFVTITFDVTGGPGQFEFDTACFTSQLNTIYMTDGAFPPIDHGAQAIFEKGVVTIEGAACDCSGIGDCDADGVIDPVDVVFLINYAFRNAPAPPTDLLCTVINRGDWNCDDKIDLLDIVKMVNYVYRYPAPGPCDPCVVQ